MFIKRCQQEIISVGSGYLEDGTIVVPYCQSEVASPIRDAGIIERHADTIYLQTIHLQKMLARGGI